jgi:hypothetical protein
LISSLFHILPIHLYARQGRTHRLHVNAVNALRRVAILLIVTLLAGAVSVLADGSDSSAASRGERRPPRSNDGAYALRISGYYRGSGTASVTRQAVSITADVKTEGGTAATLKAESLVIDGTYFSGEGTVGDAKVTITGRLDAARISRLVASYKAGDSHRGRIVGVLPSDSPNDKWDDDKDDNKDPEPAHRK